MKILLTGASGLVGSRFAEMYAKEYELLTPTSSELDITKEQEIKEFLETNKPEAIINFAAMTDVKKAELERDDLTGLVWKLNTDAVKYLFECAKNIQAHFIQISTDLVFSGAENPNTKYTEDSDLDAQVKSGICWYGITKLEAEKYLKEQNYRNAAVVRIAYPFREYFDNKIDIARNFIQLYDNGKLYPMFSDNLIHPTYIDEACAVMNKVLSMKATGVFHATSSNGVSHYELGRYILEKTGRDPDKLQASSMKEFRIKNPSPPRPLYVPLSVEKTEKELGIKLNTWQENSDTFVAKLTKK